MAATILDPRVAAMDVSYQMSFARGLKQVSNWWSSLAEQYPSDGSKNVYPFLMEVITARRWTDEKVYHRESEEAYELANEDFEASLGIDRNELDDDRWAMRGKQFERIGRAMQKMPDDETLALLENGKTRKGWDKVAFFSASHPVDIRDSAKGTFSNLRAAKPLNAVNFSSGRLAMRKIKAPNGRPMGITPNLLVVTSDLEETALEVVKADYAAVVYGANTAATSPTNVRKGMCEVMVLEESSEEGVWYLAATRMDKPLIVQVRKAPVLISQTSPQSDSVFDQRRFKYSGEARYGFGYGLPQLIQRNEPT